MTLPQIERRTIVTAVAADNADRLEVGFDGGRYESLLTDLEQRVRDIVDADLGSGSSHFDAISSLELADEYVRHARRHLDRVLSLVRRLPNMTPPDRVLTIEIVHEELAGELREFQGSAAGMLRSAQSLICRAIEHADGWRSGLPLTVPGARA